MSQKNEKKRLNIFLSNELLTRLESCSAKYGVSRTQLAVVLIGQGLASIEKAFELSEKYGKDIINNYNDNI